jgi:hypothetical protein
VGADRRFFAADDADEMDDAENAEGQRRVCVIRVICG